MQNRRILFIQHAGDFREAFHRLNAGGQETYYAQRYSVDSVCELTTDFDTSEIGFLIRRTETTYDEVLPNGIRVIGAGIPNDRMNEHVLLEHAQQFRPTHVILQTPSVELLAWTQKHRLPTLVVIADSFDAQRVTSAGLMGWLKRLRRHQRIRQLIRLMNSPHVQWVCNHNLSASNALRDLGVRAEKIIPWDFMPPHTPDQFTPKTLVRTPTTWRLVVASNMQPIKGVGDCVQAMSILRDRGRQTSLQALGGGDTRYLRQLMQTLNLKEQVELPGLVPNNQVIEHMRQADVVLVPSRHDAPEGLPFTIYEAFCSRTPLICSNHRMFLPRIEPGHSALTFDAGNPESLADQIETLMTDPALYARLSENSADAWQKLQCPVKYRDLLHHWLSDTPADHDWLRGNTLATAPSRAPMPTPAEAAL